MLLADADGRHRCFGHPLLEKGQIVWIRLVLDDHAVRVVHEPRPRRASPMPRASAPTGWSRRNRAGRLDLVAFEVGDGCRADQDLVPVGLDHDCRRRPRRGPRRWPKRGTRPDHGSRRCRGSRSGCRGRQAPTRERPASPQGRRVRPPCRLGDQTVASSVNSSPSFPMAPSSGEMHVSMARRNTAPRGCSTMDAPRCQSTAR